MLAQLIPQHSSIVLQTRMETANTEGKEKVVFFSAESARVREAQGGLVPQPQCTAP